MSGPRNALDEQDTQSRPEPSSRNLFLRAHQEHASSRFIVMPEAHADAAPVKEQTCGAATNIKRRTRPRNALDEQDTQSRPEPSSRNLFLRAHQESASSRFIIMPEVHADAAPVRE